MSRIKNFLLICVKCSKKSGVIDGKCNVSWRPQRALVFACYKCGEVELIKLDFTNPKDVDPQTEEEFDESIKPDKN